MEADQQGTLPEFESANAQQLDTIERIYAAKDEHFKAPRPGRFTYHALSQRLIKDGTGGPASQKTIERLRGEYPHLFPADHWPLRKDDVRPWLADPSLLKRPRLATPISLSSIGKDDDTRLPPAPPQAGGPGGLAPGTTLNLQAIVNPDGTVVWRLATLAAAGLATAAMFDLIDGRYDHIVRWCRLLMEHSHILA